MNATRVYKLAILVNASTLLVCSVADRPRIDPVVGGIADPRGDRLTCVRAGQRIGPDQVLFLAGPVSVRSVGRAGHGHPQSHTPAGRAPAGSIAVDSTQSSGLHFARHEPDEHHPPPPADAFGGPQDRSY